MRYYSGNKKQKWWQIYLNMEPVDHGMSKDNVGLGKLQRFSSSAKPKYI